MHNNKQALPLVMGILNVTPDSFSDGGKTVDRDSVIRAAEMMAKSGADLIDIGGESTRPGANIVSVDEELARVLPAMDWIREACDLPISIDTYKTEVMREVLSKGVWMINDVNALQAPGALELLAQHDVKVCLMHKQGTPQTMQASPSYENVVEEVMSFLKNRLEKCQESGLQLSNICVDPGFGFGKTLQHNVELFGSLEVFQQLNCPVLVGVSRKSMIGALQKMDLNESRLAGSLAAAIVAMQKGAQILRVHDVPETLQALRVASALGLHN
ncbi:dihydropteroate synthase [Thiosulfativibrio zosterae]|nr:dihydropteroate synthase [Thiosulfativibrio zosterae]